MSRRPFGQPNPQERELERAALHYQDAWYGFIRGYRSGKLGDTASRLEQTESRIGHAVVNKLTGTQVALMHTPLHSLAPDFRRIIWAQWDNMMYKFSVQPPARALDEAFRTRSQHEAAPSHRLLTQWDGENAGRVSLQITTEEVLQQENPEGAKMRDALENVTGAILTDLSIATFDQIRLITRERQLPNTTSDL